MMLATEAAPALVAPDQFPGAGIDAAAVSEVATDLTRRAGQITGGGAAISAAWAGLPAAYSSTGADAVYAAMRPACEAASRVGEGVGAVATAFAEWVVAVQPVLWQRTGLVAEAEAFLAEVSAFTPALQARGQAAVSGLALRADHWWQDPALAARNADLLDRGRLLGQRLRAAEAELVAAINRAARWGCVDPTPDDTADGARGDATQPESPDTPWGPPADRGESCSESVFDLPGRFAAGMGDALWDALGGVGELLSGYDFHHWPPPGWTVLDDVAAGDMPAAEERLGHWLTEWGDAWVGLGQFVSGAALGPVGPALSEGMDQWVLDNAPDGVDTSGVRAQQQWLRDSRRAVLDFLGSFVGYHAPERPWDASAQDWADGWSDWAEDPAHTAGKSVGNIGLLFAPVKGAGGLSDAARAGDAAADTFRSVRPDPHGDAPVVPTTPGRSLDIAPAVRPHVEGDGGAPLRRDSLRDNPHPSHDGIAVRERGELVAPHEAVREAQHPAGIEEPPVRQHPGAHDPVPSTPGDEPPSIGQDDLRDLGDSPVESSTTDVVTEDPVPSAPPELSGGMHPVPDEPSDPHYGQPNADHGHKGFPVRTRTGAAGWDLVQDPSAPYGRLQGSDAPMTIAERDERYVDPTGEDIWPRNNGAKDGTRVRYTSGDLFMKHHGRLLDRIGNARGRYLAVRVHGVPASFEARSLPTSSLDRPYIQYEMVSGLPPGWSIEVGEVRSAFGRPGGAIQVQFADPLGEVVSVQKMIDKGILR